MSQARRRRRDDAAGGRRSCHRQHPPRADADRPQRRGRRPGRNRLVGRPIETTFLGEASEHVLQVNGQREGDQRPAVFDVPPEMAVEFDPEDVVVLEE